MHCPHCTSRFFPQIFWAGALEVPKVAAPSFSRSCLSMNQLLITLHSQSLSRIQSRRSPTLKQMIVDHEMRFFKKWMDAIVNAGGVKYLLSKDV